MPKHGKRYNALKEKLERGRLYDLDFALRFVKENATAKFDETVELCMKLGVDPKRADQMVRGTVVLPHGAGRTVKVLVFAQGEKEIEAREAGADYVGCDDLIEKIQGGWLDFDSAVATPDVMSKVGRLGRILGPRGLMPNPKSGTVTFDVAHAVKEIKAGRIEFRVDRGGNIHAPIGKVSFDLSALKENAATLIDAVLKARPVAAKGTYLKALTVSSTMGVGVRVDPVQVVNMFKR
jgi:large subunit ribosomal protein L1